MPISLVCIIGIGTVFVGLIALILITYIMSAACNSVAKTEAKPEAAKTAAPVAKNVSGGAIANKQEIVAGVCAVIAEELGTDVSNIKVTSFKKL